MIKKTNYRYSVVFLLVFAFIMCSCSNQMEEYYEDKDHYIKATGYVSYISFDDTMNELYLAFSDLEPVFDDNNFKIVGENFEIVQAHGIREKIEIGSELEFVTAPKYWGDGYVMPIVELSVNNEVLLNFEDGFANFLEWLRKRK